MSPEWTFIFGLTALILFGWYFATDFGRRKLLLATVLTLLLAGLCLESVYPPAKKIRLGLDLQGGTSFLLRLAPETDDEGKVREIGPGMLDEAVEVIRKRVDTYGVSEPVITPQGTDRILVQIPGLDPAKIAEARGQLERVAKLEFKLVHPQSDALIPAIEAGSEILPPGYKIQSAKEERNGKPIEEKLLIKQKAEMGGEHVSRAVAYYDARGYGISFNLDSEGAKRFGEITAANVGNRLAIVLDGEVQSAPNINDAIYGGNAQITGRFTDIEARNLASVLENPLQTPVIIEETRSASPSLGADSIKSGIYAGLGGLFLTVLFVALYYRTAGLVAIVGLAINIVMLFGVMAMFNFVLTLPGIAGIILTIGMAVDANVLIYERLREEMAQGKSIGAALEAAYDKAFSAIFDANVTTLITAVILFWLATGPVKGFAVTLTLGIIASVYCAMIVTRNIFGWATHFGILKSISMLNLIPSKQFDFLGKRRLWVGISVAAVVLSIGAFAIRGEKNFGIDFRGGDLLMLDSKEKVSEGDVRKVLSGIGLGDVTIQKEVEPALGKEFISIRSPFGTSDKIEAQLKSEMPQAGFSEHRKDQVGSLVGGELAKSSLIALGLGMLGIFIYVALRFEFSFALGAIVALLHDVIVSVGVFVLLGREISLIIIGAVLTIAGYSINDTIVIFDRIREDLRMGKKGSTKDVINQALNETLSRTLLTGGTTLLAVLSLYVFGGPVLNDFALTMLIGIIAGTYSTVFIASPIVLWWSRSKGGLAAEVKRAQASEQPKTA